MRKLLIIILAVFCFLVAFTVPAMAVDTRAPTTSDLLVVFTVAVADICAPADIRAPATTGLFVANVDFTAANIRGSTELSVMMDMVNFYDIYDAEHYVAAATHALEVTVDPLYVAAATRAPTLLESINMAAWTMATGQKMFRNVPIAHALMAGNAELRSMAYNTAAAGALTEQAVNIRGSTADELLIVDMVNSNHIEQVTMNPFDAVATIHAPITSLLLNNAAVAIRADNMLMAAGQKMYLSNEANEAHETPMAQDYALRSMYNAGVAYPPRL